MKLVGWRIKWILSLELLAKNTVWNAIVTGIDNKFSFGSDLTLLEVNQRYYSD